MLRRLTGPALVVALTLSASAQTVRPHFDENALRFLHTDFQRQV